MVRRKRNRPKRKRNKSSPGNKPEPKRNKLYLNRDTSDSEGEETDYFDAEESDLNQSSDHTPPTTFNHTPSSIMQVTQDDLVSLSTLAPLLIKDLKVALKEECLRN